MGSAQVVPRLPVSLHPTAVLGVPAKHTSGLVVSIQGRTRADELYHFSQRLVFHERRPAGTPNAASFLLLRTGGLGTGPPALASLITPYGRAWRPRQAHFRARSLNPGAEPEQTSCFTSRNVLWSTQRRPAGTPNAACFFAPGQIAQKPLGRAWRPRQAQFELVVSTKGRTRTEELHHFSQRLVFHEKASGGDAERGLFFFYLGLVGSAQVVPHLPVSLHPTAVLGDPAKHTSGLVVSIQGRTRSDELHHFSHNLLIHARRPAGTPNAACFFSTWDWWARHRSSPFAILPNPPGPCLASPPSTLPGS